MLNCKISKEQFKELQGLSYWIADLNYIKEKYGENEPELQVCRDTINKCLFPELDKLSVPFWVQNTVICFSENWRNTKKEYLSSFLKSKGVSIEF